MQWMRWGSAEGLREGNVKGAALVLVTELTQRFVPLTADTKARLYRGAYYPLVRCGDFVFGRRVSSFQKSDTMTRPRDHAGSWNRPDFVDLSIDNAARWTFAPTDRNPVPRSGSTG